MNSLEIDTCEREKARAIDEVRAFFDACVPFKKRVLFSRVAELRCPELWQEFQELRAILNKPPEILPSYCTACNRYVVVSKAVIRMVSVAMILKKDNAPLSI